MRRVENPWIPQPSTCQSIPRPQFVLISTWKSAWLLSSPTICTSGFSSMVWLCVPLFVSFTLTLATWIRWIRFVHLIRIKMMCLALIQLYFLLVRMKTEMIFVYFSCPSQIPFVLQRRALSFWIWGLLAQQKHCPGNTSKQQVHSKTNILLKIFVICRNTHST